MRRRALAVVTAPSISRRLGGAQGQASDIAIQANEILRLRKSLNEILSYHTGQPIGRIENDTDRDIFMSAKDAAEYGLVDEVLGSSPIIGAS